MRFEIEILILFILMIVQKICLLKVRLQIQEHKKKEEEEEEEEEKKSRRKMATQHSFKLSSPFSH